MVLINNLTIDEINAALLHLQRSRVEVVGGEKGNTVNNITVNSSGNGGGHSVDYSSLIKQITDRLSNVETKTSENERNINQQANVNANQQSLIEEIEETLNNLTQSGITQLYFDDQTRTLTIYTTEGQYNTEIPSEEVTMSLANNVLTFTMGGQTVTVNLPYIPASEKGVAGGVATLDSSGRLPYSQLPESAMEFKGTWNASTNDPHLEDGTGTNGDFYVCTMPGTTTFGPGNTVSFIQNDRVIYDGATSKWVKLLAGQVSSVNNLSGDVVLNGTNVNYDGTSGSPTLKNKIDSVDTKASTQVDWNEGNTSSLAYIKNKPTIPAAQIQSDWTQTDSTKKDFIKHKIPIWISTTAAQDNMSPIDSVTDGNMRPVTSNAVFDRLATVLNAKIANGFWGMANPSGADNVWIRTTTQGIIPYQSGGASAGHQSLGTSSWYFATAYIQNIYGYLNGNISGSAANATKLGNIAVQTSSIGGTATETGNHWAYVTKAKFTTTSGYIVYSNGLKIQWGTDTTNTNTSQSSMKKITYPLTGGFTASPAVFASQRYDESGASCILQTFNVTATTFQINAKHATTNQYYARNFSWMAIGY